MNALDAGLLCTLLLIGTVAALLGGMSAARRRRRASFALCLAAAAPDFALLSVLLAAPAGLRNACACAALDGRRADIDGALAFWRCA